LNRFTFNVFVLVSIALVFPLVQSQNSEGYPNYEELFLNDYAHVVTNVDASAMRLEAALLRDETGIEMTVLTINSINDYSTKDTSIESFATNLFNTWGIGDSESNDGALILVAVKDRDMRIELGDGYGRSYDAMAQMVIDRYMLPQFRKDDYSTGILHGSQELNRRLRAIKSDVAVSDSAGYPVGQPRYQQKADYNESSDDSSRSLPNNYGWFAGAIAAILGGGGSLYAFMRRRRRYAVRYCQNCQHKLQLLDDLNEDVYLDDGQRIEENLKSVDYDVWLCDYCNQHELHSYPASFSAYENCPDCRYRTMKTNRMTIERADCYSGGRDEITEECFQDKCGYFNIRTVNTPARDCDDDTSSSFGGGSSSGGGASGKW